MRVQKQISTNSRVISSLLTKYRNTFTAFRELINNSIQAAAKNIYVKIDYSNSASLKAPFRTISIQDDGIGVSASEFDARILEIGTTVKKGGQGIGRFGALQLGAKMTVTTVSFDTQVQKFTKVIFPFDASLLKDDRLHKVNVNLEVETLPKAAASYYKVLIEDLYHNILDDAPRKNRISDEFLNENIMNALFEGYSFEIFNKAVTFHINNRELKPQDFYIGKPSAKNTKYTDVSENEHDFTFTFYNVRSSLNKVKIFMYVENAGIKTVAQEFTYSSDWYTPDMGTWFVYCDSSMFSADLFRNIDMDAIGDEEIRKLKDFIKDEVNNFFKKRNQRFEKFLNVLEKDIHYPYANKSAASKTHEFLFKKVAFLVEDEYKLIEKNNRIKSFIYPLIDKALSDGHAEQLFKDVLHLPESSTEEFHHLLQRTNLEDVIKFSSSVSSKLEFLTFLHDLVYGEVSATLKERSQLHKIVEKELWLFGEAYSGTPCLWSDRRLGGILEEMRERYFNYEPAEADDNLINFSDPSLNDITDLFFLNEKVTDNDEREVMVVELKSPRCAIGAKEIQQLERYAFAIEKNDAAPSEKVKYKLILISSKLNAFARSKAASSFDTYRIPFLLERKTEKNIELYIIPWRELIEANQRKLSYLSQKLKVKDRKVREKFETEYAELLDPKGSARLIKSKGDKEEKGQMALGKKVNGKAGKRVATKTVR